ncbi:MAG: DUF1343 domain-containing protein [Candidatus Hydrogenedentes bacterium]|nr:DUF1343 domain-containing protein [Candidatus Hydrogenedentota bacterium]
MSIDFDNALREAVTEAKCPGAVAYIGNRGTTYYHGAYGLRMRTPQERPAERDTIYDLASITKMMATNTAVQLLREDGKLDLDRPVADYLPIPAFKGFTLRHVITHTAGLHPGRPYYKECSSVNEMLQRYAETGIERAPGLRRRYSDVDFMILGKVVEMAAHDSLDAFCKKRIYAPLGMDHTAFNPPKEWASKCAATEKCAWRKRVIVGEVHDENAYAVGGVSGHAGLFSTAEDMAKYCRALLGGKLLSKKTIAEMTQLGQVPFYPWQGLGWELDPWSSGEMGFLFSRGAFGHTGWTGTAFWMDRDTGLFAILLANTCHPSRDHRDTATLRRTFYKAVVREFYPKVTTTHTGLDRLVRESFEPVRGKRLALLTNASAVDQQGRHILEVLKFENEATLHLLYSPEHGLKGQAEAGAKVKEQSASVPVINLYGDRKQPTAAELAQVDLFVIDLQDVGSRYYTYLGTMKACLEACAQSGTPVLVLDRPNPVGGATLEGPVASRTDSLVCAAPIPVRHGMTFGEAALFLAKHVLHEKKLNVTVSALDNWFPEFQFGACSLPWTPPSPNVPTAETALLYVGMCLFEGTNLNEGRGTETPFGLIGAPWLKAEAVIQRLSSDEREGWVLEPARYTPKSIPGKSENPMYRDRECHGIRIAVQDADAARAITLALALIVAIRALHPKDFEWKKSFDVLAGSPDLRARIERGDTAAEIVAGFEADLASYQKIRVTRYA